MSDGIWLASSSSGTVKMNVSFVPFCIDVRVSSIEIKPFLCHAISPFLGEICFGRTCWFSTDDEKECTIEGYDLLRDHSKTRRCIAYHTSFFVSFDPIDCSIRSRCSILAVDCIKRLKSIQFGEIFSQSSNALAGVAYLNRWYASFFCKNKTHFHPHHPPTTNKKWVL